MRGLVASMLVWIAACGRLGFGEQSSSGGGGNDGNRGDGGGNDDASDAGGTNGDAGGCLASYALCDGFEATTLDPVWTPSGSGVSLDATVAHRGQQSLHLHSDALAINGAAEEIVTETTTFAMAQTTFYVRAFIRLSALPANNLGLIEAQQSTGDPSGDGLFVTSAGLTLYSQFSEKSHDANFIPADDAWTCTVWTVVRATDNSGSLDLGGDATDTITNVQTDGTPAIDEMGFGIQLATSTDTAAQPAMDVWFDDVIVANTPLTCSD